MSNAIGSNTSDSTIRSVAIAILQHQDKFLMQLRDDIPTIVHPGVWTMFGGHLELGENPEICIQRELKEEINYVPEPISLFRSYSGDQVIRHVFYGRLDVGIDMLELCEGWDMDFLSEEEIIKGTHYSSRALQNRPIAFSHKQIMLDFLSSLERRINM
ncbi:NUDIX domain-containing protein [Pseudanabaena sp. FACHB-1998]|uniref:NUDIX hydrolase n=1 Tax=Pseudanabaena sp. FACHB-1998 TaxID=2692858 RepID=UPI001681A59D|nr:NUDIX domain-containing protein [Pseudanabaena sp. FACHB-1998]MBD2176195.1 NUDIX domain-containing protein [Pseudanabaena sp. FACHB-1998]